MTGHNRGRNDDVETPVPAGMKRPGEYGPAGEMQGVMETFTADLVAEAFGFSVERVRRAIAGEFSIGSDTPVDSQQAQQLAEVLLGDQPLDEREAALMRLGAFTPRRDTEWGLGDADPSEESDSEREDQPGH